MLLRHGPAQPAKSNSAPLRDQVKKFGLKPESMIRLVPREWRQKFDYLNGKTEQEIVEIVSTTKNLKLRDAAIEKLADRAQSLTRWTSIALVIRYAKNSPARKTIVDRMINPSLLRWIIARCPHEDTVKEAKERLKQLS
ncbi:MAG: hypothetical protein V1492_05520 [Candidatus Micrarchaeota archaeon]